MIFNFTTNAACPQRPTWQINEVGYEWAQVVFRDFMVSRKNSGSSEKTKLSRKLMNNKNRVHK